MASQKDITLFRDIIERIPDNAIRQQVIELTNDFLHNNVPKLNVLGSLFLLVPTAQGEWDQHLSTRFKEWTKDFSQEKEKTARHIKKVREEGGAGGVNKGGLNNTQAGDINNGGVNNAKAGGIYTKQAGGINNAQDEVRNVDMALYCTICMKRGASLCKLCSSAAYCTNACADSDRSLHVPTCLQFFFFSPNSLPKPTDKAVLAFKLNIHTTFPELVYIEIIPTQNIQILTMGFLTSFNNPDRNPWTTASVYTRYNVDMTSTDGSELTVSINCAYEPEALQANSCLAALTSGRGPVVTGPLLVFAWKKVMRNGQPRSALQDITAADLRALVLTSWSNPRVIEPKVAPM